VLSRRPGRIREIVRIEAPVSERAAIIPEVQRTLWALIRDEAATADREVQGV
jgi:NitT/TauT family transport system ATP-binding protein